MSKQRVRLGTKTAIGQLLWAGGLIAAFLIWLMAISPKFPDLAKLIWPEVWKIIGAILGPPGLNGMVNEIRKAFENTATKKEGGNV